jgi:hypothetical protein
MYCWIVNSHFCYQYDGSGSATEQIFPESFSFIGLDWGGDNTGHPIGDGLLSNIRFAGHSVGSGDNSTAGQFI